MSDLSGSNPIFGMAGDRCGGPDRDESSKILFLHLLPKLARDVPQVSCAINGLSDNMLNSVHEMLPHLSEDKIALIGDKTKQYISDFLHFLEPASVSGEATTASHAILRDWHSQLGKQGVVVSEILSGGGHGHKANTPSRKSMKRKYTKTHKTTRKRRRKTVGGRRKTMGKRRKTVGGRRKTIRKGGMRQIARMRQPSDNACLNFIKAVCLFAGVAIVAATSVDKGIAMGDIRDEWQDATFWSATFIAVTLSMMALKGSFIQEDGLVAAPNRVIAPFNAVNEYIHISIEIKKLAAGDDDAREELINNLGVALEEAAPNIRNWGVASLVDSLRILLPQAGEKFEQDESDEREEAALFVAPILYQQTISKALDNSNAIHRKLGRSAAHMMTSKTTMMAGVVSQALFYWVKRMATCNPVEWMWGEFQSWSGGYNTCEARAFMFDPTIITAATAIAVVMLRGQGANDTERPPWFDGALPAGRRDSAQDAAIWNNFLKIIFNGEQNLFTRDHTASLPFIETIDEAKNQAIKARHTDIDAATKAAAAMALRTGELYDERVHRSIAVKSAAVRAGVSAASKLMGIPIQATAVVDRIVDAAEAAHRPVAAPEAALAVMQDPLQKLTKATGVAGTTVAAAMKKRKEKAGAEAKITKAAEAKRAKAAALSKAAAEKKESAIVRAELARQSQAHILRIEAAKQDDVAMADVAMADVAMADVAEEAEVAAEESLRVWKRVDNVNGKWKPPYDGHTLTVDELEQLLKRKPGWTRTNNKGLITLKKTGKNTIKLTYQ